MNSFASGPKRNYYGKGDVIVYRLFRDGRPNPVFGANVKLLIYGDAFWQTYTTGDNTGLVATDSMKNFIQRETMNFTGSDLESYCHFLAEKFLTIYPQAEGAQVSATEIPYGPVGGSEVTFAPAGPACANAVIELIRDDGPSQAALHEVTERLRQVEAKALLRVHSHRKVPTRPAPEKQRADATTAQLEVSPEPEAGGLRVAETRSGIAGFRLLRLKGSAFAGFVRDEYTTLPDIKDRPLHMWLDLDWNYIDAASVFSEGLIPKQVRGIVEGVFAGFESGSIQEIIYQIGQKMLADVPSIAEVRLEANNRTWDTIADQGLGLGVYTDARPPYGCLGLTLKRA